MQYRRAGASAFPRGHAGNGVSQARRREPGRNPIQAWNEFFLGPKAAEPSRVIRGMFGFYPVQKKEGCITVATFSDPLVQDAAGREQPYLVIQPQYGRGRVVWLGSGETAPLARVSRGLFRSLLVEAGPLCLQRQCRPGDAADHPQHGQDLRGGQVRRGPGSRCSDGI